MELKLLDKNDELLKYFQNTPTKELMSILFRVFWQESYRDTYLMDIKKTWAFKDEVLNVIFSYISASCEGTITKQDFKLVAEYLKSKKIVSAEQALIILRDFKFK